MSLIAPAELIEDWSLYPRHAVDAAHVGNLARAYTAEVAIPPPVVDEKSKRIVDGFHRVRAWVRAFDATTPMEVELHKYRTQKDLLKDAVERNSSHGRLLDSQDRTRAALLLDRAGFQTIEIAQALHTTERRVAEVIARVVVVDGERRPAKPVVWPRPGEPPNVLSVEQYEVMTAAGGLRSVQTVRQLVRELEVGLLDLEDQRLVLGEHLGAITR
jgi:hypothetical protein